MFEWREILVLAGEAIGRPLWGKERKRHARSILYVVLYS